jgi:transcriptional repressor NrdR
MRCPFCFAVDTKVVDSRLSDDGETVRRRRECLSCHERFTTYERAELRVPQVVKSDQSREPFDEDKLRSGMRRALQKRPVKVADMEAAIARIRHKLIASGEREIPSRQIGEWVMSELRELDQVAFVRFASVYRQFEDVEAFREEIRRLESEPAPEARRKQLKLIPDSDEEK